MILLVTYLHRKVTDPEVITCPNPITLYYCVTAHLSIGPDHIISSAVIARG